MLLEACEDVAVHAMTGDELAVIVAHAVVEQQSDGIHDETLRVFVNGVLQFLSNLCQDGGDYGLLCRREVQGLALAVFEEGVATDAFGQRCAVNLIRVEQQSEGFGCGVII